MGERRAADKSERVRTKLNHHTLEGCTIFDPGLHTIKSKRRAWKGRAHNCKITIYYNTKWPCSCSAKSYRDHWAGWSSSCCCVSCWSSAVSSSALAASGVEAVAEVPAPRFRSPKDPRLPPGPATAWRLILSNRFCPGGAGRQVITLVSKRVFNRCFGRHANGVGAE